MSKPRLPAIPAPADSELAASPFDRFAAERRRFLQEGAALGGGGILAALGLGHYVSARAAEHSEAPAAAHGRPRLPGVTPMPPIPKVSQPAPLHDLKGKVAYISASSGGIGLGIARAAANAGMKVCIGYRNPERLAAALPLFAKGAEILPIKHDVTSRPGWVSMLDQVKRRFGKLHLVVNNAGDKTFARASTASYKAWDDAVAVNYTATFNSVAVCLPHMLEHGEGSHIAVTSSMSGLLPGGPLGVYTATKIAAVGLMEALRVELEDSTVGTSAFCPGGVDTNNYIDTGEPNPWLVEQRKLHPLPKAFRNRFKGRPPGMDPLEAGERVLNGVIHNDLFILTHPEYMPGVQERFEAILDSFPVDEIPPPPPARVRGEKPVLTCGIYPLEIVHREKPRKSYLTDTL
ncbi:MAG: SDR family oxidoreductase [Steroidobacteraceae bacterium]